jgi:hypothetical protein
MPGRGDHRNVLDVLECLEAGLEKRVRIIGADIRVVSGPHPVIAVFQVERNGPLGVHGIAFEREKQSRISPRKNREQIQSVRNIP